MVVLAPADGTDRENEILMDSVYNKVNKRSVFFSYSKAHINLCSITVIDYRSNTVKDIRPSWRARLKFGGSVHRFTTTLTAGK